MSALPNLFPPYGALFANPAGGISILNPGGAGGVLTSAGNASPVYMTLPVVCVNQPGIGVVMDGQTDNSAALNSIISRYPKGGTFLFPPGVCLFSQPWTFNQKANFRFVGAGSNQSGGAAATSLVYTGSGSASAIAALSSRGIKLEGLCFQWDNPGFTGYLLDFGPFSLTSGDSANITVEDCNLRPTNTSLTACAALLKLGWNYNFTASRCQFWGGQYNILGRASASEFTNTVLLQQCNFGGAVVAAIRNAQQCWKLHVCVIEPNASGAAAGLVWDAATPGEQITLDGCWLGDDNGQVPGVWIDWHGGKGLYIFGGFMGLEALTTGVRVSANASQGIFIEGLQVQGGGGNSTLIDFGSTTGHTSFYCFPANYPNGVSNGILGTIPPGVYDLGSGPVFTGATFAGTLGAEALVITGSATVGTLNVTETSNPNMLSAASADFETGVGVWSANSNCTLTTTTAAALHGTHSLQVTFADDGPPLTTMSINSIGAGWSGQVPIQPGQTWTCLASFYCPPGSTPRLLEIDFYGSSSSGGANYQRLATTGDTIREVASGWIPIHLTVTVPSTLPVGGATPAFGSMVLRWVDNGNLTVGEVHLVDCVQMAQGLSQEWQDPAETSSNIQISGNTIAQVGSNGANDIAVLAQNGGTAYVNFGSGAGTGGVHLGTPVAEG